MHEKLEIVNCLQLGHVEKLTTLKITMVNVELNTKTQQRTKQCKTPMLITNTTHIIAESITSQFQDKVAEDDIEYPYANIIEIKIKQVDLDI
jgi:hypothetical protein